MEWQPIETAPKDGTFVLLVIAGFLPVVGRWQENGECWDNFDEEDYFDSDWFGEYRAECPPGSYKPTHWMPLPNPPQE